MDDRIEHRQHSFGRPFRLVIGRGSGDAAALVEAAAQELKRLESRFCSITPGSFIYQLNANAGNGNFIAVDQEASSLLQYADALWRSSEAMYDPTTCLLNRSYGSERRTDELAALLPLVGWQKLEIGPQGARLTQPGMLLDLNNCVRPYAVDCLRKMLQKHGADSALIDLDRDLATIGRQPNGSNWTPGLRAPRSGRAAFVNMKLNQGSLAIRGDFERSLDIDGERFGCAFRPDNGQLIAGPLTVVISADSCLSACGAASVARLKPQAEALEWLETLGMPWLAIDRKLNCHGPLRASLGL